MVNDETPRFTTTTRQLARNIAKKLANTDWVPEGIEKPLVFLDGISGEIDIRNRPTVVVVPKNATGLWKSTPEHIVEVVLAVNSAYFVSNPALSNKDEEGVEIFGAGDVLDSLTFNLLNMVKHSTPGAILSDVQLEYSMDSLPVQYVSITATYRQNAAYGDFCN